MMQSIDDSLGAVLPALEPVRDRRISQEYMRQYCKTVLLYYEQSRVDEQLKRQRHDQESRVLRSELFNLVECLSDDMDRRLSLETEVFDEAGGAED